MGRDEWKTNSFPDTPAACGKTKSRELCYTLHVVLLLPFRALISKTTVV